VNLLLALIGCDRRDEPTDEGTAPPPVCGEVNDTQFSAGLWTSITSPGCGSLELGNFRVLGEGTFTVDLFSDGERVIPHVVAEMDGVFRGLDTMGTFTLDGEQPMRLWRQAYASGPSAIEDLPDALALDEDGVPILEDEPPGTSAWAGLVGRDDGASAVVGVHSAVLTRFAAAFAADGTVHAVWGGQGEALPLAAGNELFLDPLFLAMGRDPNELWDTWVAAVAENAGIVPPRAAPPLGFTIEVPAYYPALDELQEALDGVVALQSDPGLDAPTVVVVEGWETSLDTTADMADEIHAAGLVAGIRVAPFSGDFDVTQPDAAADVGTLVERLIAEGWEMLVLDDLGAAAVEGVRSAPTTGTLAYRAALELVRAAAGDAWITAMDAPLLPSVGLVDGFRIGAESDELAGRVFTGGVWWWIDGGIVAEDSYGGPAVVTGEAVAAAIAGGTWQVDRWTVDLASVLSPALHALSAPGTRPLEPLAGIGPPARWVFGTGEIALVNWSDSSTTVLGPGGEELLTGEIAEPGERILSPGAGEVWIPAE